MYASIRQGKVKAGMAEELTRRIKEGAIPVISDVEGFMAYYVVYAPDDTVTAISIFKDYGGDAELKQTSAGVDRTEPCAAARWTSYSDCWASDRPYFSLRRLKIGEVNLTRLAKCFRLPHCANEPFTMRQLTTAKMTLWVT